MVLKMNSSIKISSLILKIVIHFFINKNDLLHMFAA